MVVFHPFDVMKVKFKKVRANTRLDPPVAQRLVALAVVTTGIESDQKLEHFFGGA